MTSELLVTVAMIAAAVAAVAIVAMAIMVIGMLNAVATIRDQTRGFLLNAENLMNLATQTVADNQRQVRTIISNAPEIVAITHNVVTRLDEFVDDVTKRAKVQLDRLELVKDDTVERVHRTTAMLDTVLKPVGGVSGVARELAQQLRRRS